MLPILYFFICFGFSAEETAPPSFVLPPEVQDQLFKDPLDPALRVAGGISTGLGTLGFLSLGYWNFYKSYEAAQGGTFGPEAQGRLFSGVGCMIGSAILGVFLREFIFGPEPPEEFLEE